MRLWNLVSGQEIHAIKNAHVDYVTCARFTPDERYLVSTGLDHLIKVFDVRNWKQVSAFEDELYTTPNQSFTNKICVSPNSQYVVAGSQTGAVVVLDIKNAGQCNIAEIYEDEHDYAVIGAEWVPSKSSFCTIDSAGGLYMWSK